MKSARLRSIPFGSPAGTARLCRTQRELLATRTMLIACAGLAQWARTR
jgi:hypothetical protein